MKNDTTQKQIAAARAAVNEVERLLASIRARTEAPKLLWQKRRAEHAKLLAELKAECFDPSEPHAEKALALHAERVTKCQAFEKLFEQTQKVYPIDFGPFGKPLFAAICELQKLLWGIAEHFELDFTTLRRHGVFALSPNAYTPERGAVRLIDFSRNFPLEGAGHLLSLAREILSRRVPALPAEFARVDRPLTYAERTFITNKSTRVASPA